MSAYVAGTPFLTCPSSKRNDILITMAIAVPFVNDIIRAITSIPDDNKKSIENLVTEISRQISNFSFYVALEKPLDEEWDVILRTLASMVQDIACLVPPKYSPWNHFGSDTLHYITVHTGINPYSAANPNSYN